MNFKPGNRNSLWRWHRLQTKSCRCTVRTAESSLSSWRKNSFRWWSISTRRELEGEPERRWNLRMTGTVVLHWISFAECQRNTVSLHPLNLPYERFPDYCCCCCSHTITRMVERQQSTQWEHMPSRCSLLNQGRRRTSSCFNWLRITSIATSDLRIRPEFNLRSFRTSLSISPPMTLHLQTMDLHSQSAKNT